MQPQITVENSVGNKINIQNDVVSRISTYLTKEHIVGVSNLTVENTTDFGAYNTTVTTPTLSAGTQTWNVGSTTRMRVGDSITTSGATTQAFANITSINSATQITVLVWSAGSGTATGVLLPKSLVIGRVGTPTCELSSTVTTPAAKTIISLSSSVQLTHKSGETVSEVLFDTIEIYKSTTENGSYALISNTPINLTQPVTEYLDMTGLSTDWYKIRFSNSLLNYTAGSFAPAFSPSSTSTKSASYLINEIRNDLGIDENDQDITSTFLISALNTARKIVNTNLGYGKRNEWRQEFNYPIKMLAGTNYVSLPSNIDFTDTDRSLLNVKYTRNFVSTRTTLSYLDKTDYNDATYLNTYSETTQPHSSGATSITLTSTGDFPSTGTAYVSTNLYPETVIAIRYTSNNLSTNTLTGVTGLTRGIAIGTQIWVAQVTSLPLFYTVWDGRIYFDKPIPDSLQGKNCYIDYYKIMTDITSLSQEIPEHYRNIYKDYIAFAIKRRKDDTIGEEDPDYTRFLRSVNSVFGNPHTGQNIRIVS